VCIGKWKRGRWQEEREEDGMEGTCGVKLPPLHRRQSWGLGYRDPPQILGWGLRRGLRGGLRGGRGRVSEKTIAYFAQKASFFVSFLRKREKLTSNVGM